MEKTEDTKTTLILSNVDRMLRDKCQKLLKAPLTVQKFEFFSEKAPKFYHVDLIVDKPDRVSVINKVYRLRIGNSGLFLKADSLKKGLTYHKVGRSSSRLSMWQDGHNEQASNFHLLKLLSQYVNPDACALLGNDIINSIATKGMRGSILAGKITNTTEAMTYFIRYSMRGVGISLEMSDSLYEFYNSVNQNVYILNNALRYSDNPNELLKYFKPYFPHNNFVSNICKDIIMTNLNSSAIHSLIKHCQILDIKVDLANPQEFTDERLLKLSKKEKGIKELLNIWDGGPVLNDLSGQINNPIADLPF